MNEKFHEEWKKLTHTLKHWNWNLHIEFFGFNGEKNGN